MDLSNKSLSLLLVASIVLSLGGTIISLNKLNEGVSGHATAAGQLNLSISSNTSCSVDSNISFGSSGKPSSTITLSTDLDNSASGFNNCTDAATTNNCKGLQINNTGNTNLNITFSSNANASTLLVAQTNLDATDFVYRLRNGTYANTTQGCRNITGITLNGAVPQSTEVPLCHNLTFADGSDILTIEYNITLEPDVQPGTKTAGITITCEQTTSG